MLIRDKLTLLDITEVTFDDHESKFHFKSYKGMTVMKMPIPNLNKALANKVLDLMLFIHMRDGYIDVYKISEIANNLDKLEDELKSLTTRHDVEQLEDVQKLESSEVEESGPEPSFDDLLAEKLTVEDIYGMYVWCKVNELDFEDNLKRAKATEIARLTSLFDIETEKQTSRGAKAKLIIEKLSSMRSN